MNRILVLLLAFGLILSGCTTTTESHDDGWHIPAGPVDCSDTDGGKDAFNAELTARGSGDKKIQIKLQKKTEKVTEIKIRVGLFGDESMSRQILDKIKSRF